MTTRRARDLERICLSALERPAAERAAFLFEACGSDEELRREAESLIARDQPAVSLLETPPLSGAASLAFAATVPTMAAGERIGPYTIVSNLGSGGMGEVYRARDATLDREVAIKVLSSLFTTDPQRLGRFEREARLLASLNHPNIATLHGIEHGSGIDGVHTGGPEGSPAVPNTGTLLRVLADGTFDVVVDHLNQPTSLEVIGTTAYVVTIGGEIWRIDGVVRPPFGTTQ
jgi:serine/threonine protein kinase